MKKSNWNLYLVTEAELSRGRDSIEVVKAAIAGGIDAVQLREKNMSLRERFKLGQQLKKICQKAGVIFIVNDRIDLALALEADGVHLGQSDLPALTARELLGSDQILGISAHTREEIAAAESAGADYIGIGAIFPTKSKKLTENNNGIGLKKLAELKKMTQLPVVAIGGINESNVGSVIKAGADTIAVISALTRADDIKQASQKLKNTILSTSSDSSSAQFNLKEKNFKNETKAELAINIQHNTLLELPTNLADCWQILKNNLTQNSPLIQHLTNNVTINDCANVTLNWGALPVMTSGERDSVEMLESASALVLNIGSIDKRSFKVMLKSGKKANQLGIPIVLDPVGVGATEYRTCAIQKLITELDLAIIKGNQAEISILAGQQAELKGVESIGEYQHIEEAAKKLAAQLRTIIVVSAAEDIITDGIQVQRVKRGDQLLGQVVGTGCMLTSSLAVMMGVKVKKNSNFIKAATLVYLYSLLAEKAAVKIDTPAKFKQEFFDQIFLCSQ